MTLQDVVKFLKDNRYLLVYKETYSLSQSFNDDVKNMPLVVALPPAKVLPDVVTTDWKLKFIEYITASKVPRLLPAGHGDMFQANSYHEGAMQAFKTMITKEGIKYDILVKCTLLYYKSGSAFKKKISNYILDGDWLTDYRNLELAAMGGETKLIEHIKEELNNGEHNPYSY